MVMTPFTVGEVLAAADLNELCLNTRYAVKGADTSRASNTTIADDPDLTLAVDASKSYAVKVMIVFTAATSGDLKFTFTVPAGAVFTGTVTEFSTVASAASISAFQASGSLITSTQSTTGGASSLPVVFDGVLTTSTTAGNFTFRWAQVTSNATATIVRQGSSMFLRRVS